METLDAFFNHTRVQDPVGSPGITDYEKSLEEKNMSTINSLRKLRKLEESTKVIEEPKQEILKEEKTPAETLYEAVMSVIKPETK